MQSRYPLAFTLVALFASAVAAQPVAPPPLPPSAAQPAPGAVPPPPPAPPPAPPSIPAAVPRGDTMTPFAAASAPPAASVEAAPVEVTTADLPRPRGFYELSSLGGPIGLFRMSAAEAGAPSVLRFGLHGEYFKTSNFLIQGDRNMRLQGALALGFSPIEFLEIFGSISGSANRNRRLCSKGVGGEKCVEDPGRVDPEVIKSYGDLLLGGKFARPIADGFSGGAEIGLHFLSSVSGISFDPGATSVWLSGLGSWDMREVADLPLRAHLNLGMYFDNSGDVQNYKGVPRNSQAVSQFAYGVAKTRLRTGLGIEAPIENIGDAVTLRPSVEYHMERVTAGADKVFNDYRPPLCKGSSATAGSTPCRDNRDQHWITLGVRAQGKSGLTVGVGVDLALRSVGFPYGPPLPPFNLLFGLWHPLDLGASKMITRTVTVDRPVPALAVEKRPEPVEGFVAGKVLSANGGAPIEKAIVAVAGRTRSRVATDPDGTFRTASLPPGPVELEIAAPGFVPGSVKTEVTAGQEKTLAITLTPKVSKGKVSGKVADDAGKPLAATVKFIGPENVEAKTDAAGSFEIALAPGSYDVQVEADKRRTHADKVTVADGDNKELNATLRTKPTNSRVTIKGGRIAMRGAIGFKGTDLTPGSQALLDEMADALLGHPEIKKVRIEAHWDSSLPGDKAKELTEQQATAVAVYLARHGVPQDRLEAVGMGSSRPIVPNIGAAKLRNRRVEFRAAK